MTTVFVSYGSEDQEVVRSLAEDLGELGHKIWFDRDLTGGRAWWDDILGRIRECDVFVAALSPASLDSEACKRECAYAFKLGKSLLPVLVSDVRAELLPPILAEIQYVDYRRQDKSAVFSLMKAFGTLAPGRPLPDPLPDPPAAPLSYLGGLMEQITASTPLSFEAQTALLLRLDPGLRDPKTADNAKNLLLKLRARDDLFARVAEEIDRLLATGSARPQPSERARPDPTRRAEPRKSTAAATKPADPPTVEQAPTAGRFVGLLRWLLAIAEFHEYAELRRRHWAAVREQPSFATIVQWLFGDARQYVLLVRIALKLLLLMGIVVVLRAIAHS